MNLSSRSSNVSFDYYRIRVEKAVQPTYDELKLSYDWVGACADASKFPHHLHESLRDVVPPTGDVDIFLMKAERSMLSETAIKLAHEHGYRLAFPWEREAFAKANPDLQRQFWILDFGTYVIDMGEGEGPGSPALCQTKRERNLGYTWIEDGLTAGDRVILARK